MEQRPLRLGDIVDDYCTRERRVTNHVIVVVAEDAIRQTRCTTCENEHPYKGGKEPRLRKKPGTPSLYDQVLSNTTGASPNGHASDSSDDSSVSAAMTARADGADQQAAAGDDQSSDESQPGNGTDDAWPAHRTLIRASLPRTDEPPPPRPIPEFTMYQRPQPRGRNFRFGGPHRPFGHSGTNGTGNGEANGNTNGNANGNRPARPGPDGRPGQPSGRRRRRRRAR